MENTKMKINENKNNYDGSPQIKTNSKKLRLYILTGVFVAIGIGTLLYSFASTGEIKFFEVNSGQLSNAIAVNDATASGGTAVQLTSAGSAPSGWPSPDSYQVCGNSAILNGPTSAPQGAITINPGTDLANATNVAAAGSTFYLTAGTHTISSPIAPKTGNTHILVLQVQY